MIQAEGVVATFLCQHPQADNINWRLNGTGLNRLNPRPSGIRVGEIGDLLNITALSGYNNTEVRCVALLLNGTTELSSPVYLTVQGHMLF